MYDMHYSQAMSSVQDKPYELHSHFPPIAKRTVGWLRFNATFSVISAI